MKKKKKPIKIIHRKLGREKAHGLAFKEDRIAHLDPRLSPEDTLHTLVHEILHIQNPTWSEIKVTGHAKEMFEILWQYGYRKVNQ